MGLAARLIEGELSELELVRGALADEYDVLAELGRGGMAIVFRARDRALERDVAIKVLPLGMAYDRDLVERFQREVKIAAQLEHPNIVPIYRVGKSGGERVSYFVMKYVRGPSLGHVLAERPNGKLAPDEIRAMLADTARALAYAARNGVVHRDIKPDNILFDDDRWMLADFGIAKVASARTLTNSGQSVGTPRYMSPEQARARPIDKRADIYSLGIVAYQCLVGRVPFDGEDGMAILFGHVSTPVPTPILETAAEQELFEIIRRMIAKDPDHRVQDGDELLRLLLDDGTSPSSGSAPLTGSASPSPAGPNTRLASGDVTPLIVRSPVPATGVDAIRAERGAAVDQLLVETKQREKRRGRWLVGGLVVVFVAAVTYAGWPSRSRAAQTSAVTPAPAAMQPIVAQAPAAAVVPVAPAPSAPVEPRPTFCDAAAGTPKFHVLMDPITPQHAKPTEMVYAVCGLAANARYHTVVTLLRRESGIKKLLGSTDRMTAVFDDRAGGSAVHARHWLPRMDQGAYALTLTVTDARGRKRTLDETLSIP